MDEPIIIVGAGVSGLVTAIELESRGYSPVILESSDRPGGRVQTSQSDGFLLDHGFQVLLTAYPEARHYLDYDALDLRFFESGALVHTGDSWTRIGDPSGDYSLLFTMLLSDIGTLGDKYRIYKLRKKLTALSLEEIFRRPESSTRDYLHRAGFSERIIERFFRPFFSGIFLENELLTSSRMFEFVFKMFSEGRAAVPSGGMAKIPEQLAAKLGKTQILYNQKVTSVSRGFVSTSAGDRAYGRLVLTVPPDHFLPGAQGLEYQEVHCFYFSTKVRKFDKPVLMLSAGKGLINNMHYADAVARDYSKHGHLLSVSVVGEQDMTDLRQRVERELMDKFRIEGKFIRAFHIPKALPVSGELSYSIDPGGTRISENIFIAGDQLLYPSLNAAMHSGRLAAEAVHRSVS